MSLVRAAGGVLWRAGPGGMQVVAVRRPRYEDWSLPKGKLFPGEHELAAAVREVREETGITGIPQVRLPSVQYLTGDPDVEKTVDFWSMRVYEDEGREPDHEVAEVRWVPVSQAPALLTYAHDRGVVAAFAALPPIECELVLLRHAHAGSRNDWAGADELRPLSELGRRQAARLAPILALFHPVRAVSGSFLRCQQTLTPLGLPVQVEPRLDETRPAGLAGARDALLELAAERVPAAVAGHGKVIPPLLASLKPGNASTDEQYATPKGAGWVLAFAGTDLVVADRLPLS